MGIQLSGFNSGMPVNDIISQLLQIERRPINLLEQRKADFKLKQGVMSNVESRMKDLLAAVEKMTRRSTLDNSTIFNKLKGVSTDDGIATASVDGTASPQTISLEVRSLPSQTTAVSNTLIGKFDNATLLSEIGVTDGNFTIFANGVAHTITVTDATTETMGDIFSQINATIGAISSDPTIVDGRVTINYDPGNTINLGAGGDTSNFLAKSNLLAALNDGNGTITASQVNTTINTGVALSDAAANLTTAVTEGTFTINGVSFDTTGKSMNDIVAEINESAAGVTAGFNKGTNRFELKAKDTGSKLITLGDDSNGGGSGNFLTAMGLISGTNTTASQTAGKNTEFVLNGVTMYSTSTSVDETITGITGVTLDLKKAQPGTTIQIEIAKDNDSMKAAIKDVLDKLNKVFSYIDEQTDAEAKKPLAGETRLIALRNQLRQTMTSQVSELTGTGFDSFQSIGIKTSKGATSTFTLDEAAFDAAFAADPESVRLLFVGQNLGGAQDGSAADDDMDGTLTKIWRLIDDKTYVTGAGTTGFGALYNGPGQNDKGLFAGYKLSIDNRIKDLDRNIDRGEERLERKEKMLRQQFVAMERLIGQFQAQGSALDGLMSQLYANNKR